MKLDCCASKKIRLGNDLLDATSTREKGVLNFLYRDITTNDFNEHTYVYGMYYRPTPQFGHVGRFTGIQIL